VIRLGVVGCNFGRAVHVPAFRADPRCEVIALAGTNLARVTELARAVKVPRAYGDWRALVDDPLVQAMSIAVPPSLQSQIAIYALERGKPVFAEKPMAGTIEDANAMLRKVEGKGLPAMIDFNFHQVVSWQRAKAMLDEGMIGSLRHVVVNWQVETKAIEKRIATWKTLNQDGGGVLGNFVSHCFHYLEWFCGPVARLAVKLSGLPGDDELQTTAAMIIEFGNGRMANLCVSCASYLGVGHRIEFYGEDGTLVLHNPSSDYMRGFDLFYAKRPTAAMARITIEDKLDAQYEDGRITSVSRLAKRFLDAIESGVSMRPDFRDGYRVQQLLDAAERSHRQGAAINVEP
jgi:predicted dehydrogenase